MTTDAVRAHETGSAIRMTGLSFLPRLHHVSVAPQQEQTQLVDVLSERDASILGFERQWWKFAGSKEQAIRELFDLSPTRYYQILNGLIDSPAALAADPMLVKRLRRLRSGRQRARSAKRLGVSV